MLTTSVYSVIVQMHYTIVATYNFGLTGLHLWASHSGRSKHSQHIHGFRLDQDLAPNAISMGIWFLYGPYNVSTLAIRPTCRRIICINAYIHRYTYMHLWRACTCLLTYMLIYMHAQLHKVVFLWHRLIWYMLAFLQLFIALQSRFSNSTQQSLL